ncbi:hypothetical protein LARI1_G008031 [Lachnellula arida]|uniref:Secreted protein n=1 Tax=Lachnellula arida TaxID=1316785 RepID=A0A8T9B9W6_9HELO|nr:hypothetical protein LARI1_G008031 [Lachnellula arida]
MFFKTVAAAAAVLAVGVAADGRPSNTSICDYYTTALLKNNTAANQLTLLTLVVNTAVIGNYTKPNVGIAVPGILAKGTYNGTAVNLAPYFNGGLASTNTGGSVGRSVNFLDGGGAAPLMKNMPATDNTSLQYTLLTHLYEYFGVLLGCSMQGGGDFPAYTGHESMYTVHQFMDLSAAEVGYFIQQVALSAASFGVATDDLTAVGKALTSTFDVKCAPATTVIKAQGPQLQSICIDSTCPLAVNSTCDMYNGTIVKPTVANATLAGNTTASSSASSTMGSSSSTTTSKSGAVAVSMSFTAVFGGLAAFFL